MNSRKRQAVDPLLPLHAPKQRRTTMVGYHGGNPSPSQEAGIQSRWSSILKDFKDLSIDTISYCFERIKSTVPRTLHEGSSTLPVHGSNGVPPEYDSQTCAASTSGSSYHTRQTPPSSPFLETGRIPSSSLVTNTPSPQRPQPDSDSPSAAPSSPTVVHNGGDPRMDATLSSTRKVIEGGVVRRYENKPHIFEKKHKASVWVENEKSRKELLQAVFNAKRKRGYGSSYADFESFITFGMQLEKLEGRGALSPSSSLVDLRMKKMPSNRRHSYSNDDDIDFLRRALEKAQNTLNQPPPARPFQPSLDQLQLSYRIKDSYIEQHLRPKRTPPTPLPPEADAQVNVFLNKRGVIAKFAKEQVNDQDLSRLRPGQWLNDEIINFYGALILGRSEGCKENVLNAHYFSTFFWSKLKEGYEKSRLAKWTKKIDIFSKDIILIPVNHSNAHWTGAAINFARKRIESYDSMGGRRDIVFQLLRSYIDSEHRNKKKKPFDFTGWEDHSLEEPLQENGYDCGVFTCQFLQGLSRGDEFVNFTQKDMPSLRRRMIWEIGNATLREDP